MGAKLSFELDAGKILAKLHAGACETHPKYVFINTGITDDQQGLKIENVDKSKVNFDMEGGEYELGVMFPAGEAVEQLKADVKAADDEAKKEAAEQAKKNAGKDDDKGADDEEPEEDEADENAPITDNPKEKANESLLSEDYAKNTATHGDAPEDKDPKALKDQKDAADELNQATDELNQAIVRMAASTDVAELDKMGKAVADATKKLQGTAKEAAAAAVQKNHDQIKKFMEKSIKFATNYLNDYLKVFAGEDAAKINVDSIATCYVPEGFDPYKTKKYDKYQIPVMTDEQVRSYKVELLKKNPNEFNIERMCFKVAYAFDTGK